MTILYNKSKLRYRRSGLRINQTPQEVILWTHLRRDQLGYKFRRQHSIGSYILDFYCAQEKLAVELDGYQHIENKEYDRERSEYLSVLGIKVIRFWNNEVNVNINEVIQKIISELKLLTKD
jgi:very-short-patch-repair endonuclease